MISVIVLILMITVGSYGRRNAACSLEFSLIGSKCYHFSKEATNWDEAYYQCLGKNSSLAILSHAKEEKYLRGFLRRHYRAFGRKNRWIGGKFDWKNNKWIWAETGENVSYNAFAKAPPKDGRLLQWMCIAMDSSRLNKWTFRSCIQRNHYVCQKRPKHPIRIRKKFNIKVCKRSGDKLTDSQKRKCLKLIGGYGGIKFSNIPAPIIQTPKPSGHHVKDYVCPSNMFVIKNKCYFFSHDALNWNDAYWACQDNRTYLAVVHNKMQDELLREFLDRTFVEKHERWIGGLYDWKQKRWLWANSGNSLKYTGFPFKNYIGTQFEWRSITIDPNIGNMWNSRLRTERKHYICQKRAKTIVKLGDFNTEGDRNQPSNSKISYQETAIATNGISE